MLVELIGLLKSPDMRLAMRVNRGTDIRCLLISETLQDTPPCEFNNISKLDSKATRAKVSINSSVPSSNFSVRKSPSQFALCSSKTNVCVCVIIVVPHVLLHDGI